MTLEDPAEKGFLTDQVDPAEAAEEADEHTIDPTVPMPEAAATVFSEAPPIEAMPGIDLSVLDDRPGPGIPRAVPLPAVRARPR